MKLNRHGLAIAFAMALLALGSVAVLAAQEEGAMEEPEAVTLTGQLEETADAVLVLIEPESGEEVIVVGPGLADHVGSTVTVTGSWDTDEEGNTFLAVTSVSPSDAT